MNIHPFFARLDDLRANWAWFLVLGIALIVLGAVSLGAAGLSTLASVLTFGWLLVFGGTFEAITAFWAGRQSGFWLHLFAGLLFAVGGVLILAHPVASVAGLTLLLAALFLTGGLFRIIAAALLQYRSWGWAILDGVVTMLLGVLIWAAWPSSSLWVIGTFLGIALLFRGWAWVMFALGVHQLPKTTEDRGRRDEGIRPAA
jgi:uncharacterized membrane protein HdeD (DUF308 family)